MVDRPEPATWSALEYGCHVRDVLYNLRDRIVVGLAEDNPVPKAMFADLRIERGLYAADDPATLAAELDLAGGLFARTVAALDAEALARPIFYGWPTPATRTLLWVAAQALHETEHHLADVTECAGRPVTFYGSGMRVALITGAGTGIGRAAALALARDGFTVVLSGRRREPLDDVVDELERRDDLTVHGHLAVQADVADAGSVDALFGAVEQHFGRIDLLFNNAGTGAPPVPFEELTLEQWQAVVDTNLTGAFLCSQRAIALMKRQSPSGGRIINNGSISAHTPRPNSAPYTATKHAITGLTKSIALDGRPFGITCGQIDIGNAATPMTERMTAGVLQPDGSVKPEARMDTDDVARAIAYMASLPPEANVLTMTVMATQMPFVGRG